MLIGDVARRSGVSARMLRHYDSLGLVRPTGRTVSGYREYSADDIRRIFHIESLRSLGMSLREVGRALDDPGFEPSALVDDLIRQTGERIAREQELLTRLRRIGTASDWEEVLQTVALLHALTSESTGTRQRAALTSPADAPVEALVEAVLSESETNVAGTLRWALERSSAGAPALLAKGLTAPGAEIRRRAVRALAEIPGAEATTLLRGALTDEDPTVRRCAATALGPRGVADAIPTLVDMIVADVDDAVATDALDALATDPSLADQIATRLTAAVTSADPPTRRRLAQALADIPGETASRALAELSHDDDHAVALTASYIQGLRKDQHPAAVRPTPPGRPPLP